MPLTRDGWFARGIFFAAALGIAAVAAAGDVRPQEADADVGEVIVTTTKLREPLQRSPASVRVAGAGELERAGVVDFEDLPQIVPSLTISKTTQPANASINVRGIGTYAFSIAVEPSVTVLVDDVPQAFQAAAFTSLVDVQQVEVLRGAQTTTFGKAATAGVVRITTAPVSPTFTGRVYAMQTDDHERRLQGSVSGPVSESLGYRVAANYSDYRGALYNVATSRWLNGQTDANVRGKLAWRPSDDWSVHLSSFWNRTDGRCCAAAETYVPSGATTGSAATGPGRIPAAVFLADVDPGPGNRRVRTDVGARGDSRHAGGGLRVEYRRGSLTVLSLSSYEDYVLLDLQDTDSTDVDFSRFQPASPPGGSANGGRFDVTAATQELRLQSDAVARTRFVVGAFWSRTRSAREFTRGSNALGDYSLATPPGVLRLPVVPSRLPTTNDTSFSRYRARSTSENVAVFAEATVRVTPIVDLLAGLRRSRDRVGYTFLDQVNDVAYGSPRCSPRTPSGIAIRTCDRDVATTGRVGVRVQPAADRMVFATYARGHKGRAYDLSSTLTLRGPAPATSAFAGQPLADVVAATQPVPAEVVDDYELGAKTTFLGGRAAVNVTAFHMIYRNLQAQSRDLLLSQNVLNSVKRATSSGLEAEAVVRTGALTVSAAGAYNRTRIGEFPTASCYRGQTVAEGCVRGVQDIAGSALPNAPRWSMNVQGQYEVPVAATWLLFGTVAWRWQSAVNFSLLGDPAARQPSYGVTNLAVGFTTGAWKVTAFANNVLARRYLMNGGRDAYINNPPGEFARSWRPARDAQRTLGLRVSYEF